MGNSSFSKAPLKAAILSGDLYQLRSVLTDLESNLARSASSRTRLDCVPGYVEHGPNGGSYQQWLLSQPLNKKGDPALTLAVRSEQFLLVEYILECGVHVNMLNKDKDTALDVLLKRNLPCDGDILHYHFRPDFFPNAHTKDRKFVLSKEAKHLLKHGAKGANLHVAVLHLMKEEGQLREIAELIPNLTSEDNFRLSGLLLQSSVWFEQYDFLKDLLQKGVDPENFWKAQFVPTIVPNTDYRQTLDIWERMSTDTEGEYVLSSSEDVTADSSSSLQSLKLAFVQDWRSDWFDCQNPDAQFRAGQLLTLEGAMVMIKAANDQSLLDHVVNDIMQYLPPICGGPDLKDSPLILYLVLAGYNFTLQEVLQLKLKYNMDFSTYLRYNTTPKSLKHLSRLCIRSSVQTNMFHAMTRLGCLPPELQQFLLLNDIDKCDVEE